MEWSNQLKKWGNVFNALVSIGAELGRLAPIGTHLDATSKSLASIELHLQTIANNSSLQANTELQVASWDLEHWPEELKKKEDGFTDRFNGDINIAELLALLIEVLHMGRVDMKEAISSSLESQVVETLSNENTMQRVRIRKLERELKAQNESLSGGK